VPPCQVKRESSHEPNSRQISNRHTVWLRGNRGVARRAVNAVSIWTLSPSVGCGPDALLQYRCRQRGGHSITATSCPVGFDSSHGKPAPRTARVPEAFGPGFRGPPVRQRRTAHASSTLCSTECRRTEWRERLPGRGQPGGTRWRENSHCTRQPGPKPPEPARPGARAHHRNA
jgi:hypothetical protein